jgi:hypothetical protein
MHGITRTASVLAMWSALGLLMFACGSDAKPHPDAALGGTGGALGANAGPGGAAGHAGPGGAAGHAGTTAGAAASAAGTGGNAGTNAGVDAGTDAAVDELQPSYGPGTIQPDSPLTKVTSCTTAPDFALCNVVTTPDRDYDVCMAGVCISPGCGTPACNTQGVHFLVPPRGEARFEKSAGNEPVTIDKITGLHWQSCLVGVSGKACDQGAPTKMVYADAIAYCNALSWGGHDDWYVPDPNELLSIGLDPEAAGAGADTFPNFVAGQETTTSAISSSHGFQVDEYGTTTQYGGATWTFTVRCVRRGFSKDAGFTGERFEAAPRTEKEPTTRDRATGLTWLPAPMARADGMKGFLITEAAAACAALTFGGFSDWRLPIYRELHSLYVYPKIPVQDAALDPRFSREGPHLIAAEGYLISTEGRSIGGSDKLYPAYCVRGPFAK